MDKRSFSIVGISTTTGHVKGSENLEGTFNSSSPMNAAKKVASKVCRMSKIKGQCTLIIHVIEKSTGKKYSYKVKRVKNPVKIERGETVVTFKYALTAKSLNKPSTPSRK